MVMLVPQRIRDIPSTTAYESCSSVLHFIRHFQQSDAQAPKLPTKRSKIKSKKAKDFRSKYGQLYQEAF
jgi:hypothetical protein